MNFKYDLREIWEMQEKLDFAILTSRNTNYDKTFKERTLAFLVEVAEFANESRYFKYWSNKPASDRSILLEEYVDGIHFIIAQGIYFNTNKIYQVQPSTVGIVELTINVMKDAAKLLEKPNKEQVEKILNTYLQIAIHHKFSEKDILEHYIKKNKINYQRIKDNY